MGELQSGIKNAEKPQRGSPLTGGVAGECAATVLATACVPSVQESRMGAPLRPSSSSRAA